MNHASRARSSQPARPSFDRAPAQPSRAIPASHAVRPSVDFDARIARADLLGHHMTAGQVPPIQAKLTVGPVDDSYEREADQVARQVVAHIDASETGTSENGAQADPGIARQDMIEQDSVSRMAEDELEEDTLSRMAEDELEEDAMPLQAKLSSGTGLDGGVAHADVERSIEGSRSSGQAMGEGIRGSMESAFGADFGGVRVHHDSQSDQLSRSLQARAFTTGQDVYFRQGEYQPQASAGRELLAHELTHVVQQTGAKPTGSAS